MNHSSSRRAESVYYLDRAPGVLVAALAIAAAAVAPALACSAPALSGCRCAPPYAPQVITLSNLVEKPPLSSFFAVVVALWTLHTSRRATLPARRALARRPSRGPSP